MTPWHPHPDTWLLLGTVVLAYLYGLRRWRPEKSEINRRETLLFLGGCAVVLVSLDWPIHELAEQYLYSFHTIQHLLLSLVAPPLLMLGIPPWMYRRILGRGLRLEVIRTVTRPVTALLIFNGVIALIHWPNLVNAMSTSYPVHIGVHQMIIFASLIMWTPVIGPVLELPKLSYPGRMFYLFLQSIVPTVPASFLTFATTPLYRFYVDAPRIWGISALQDMQVAGLIMKIGGGLILWAIIAVMFFKWYAQEQKDGFDALAFRDVDRELSKLRVRNP